MMDVCRICLAQGADKDITQLKLPKKEPSKSYVDILLFCLDIQVIDSKVTSKLCSKCFKKIISYHKFKALAMKNDIYLHNLEINIKIEENAIDYDNIKTETTYSLVEDEEIKDEVDAVDDGAPEQYNESDDEFLSVIKMIKNESDDKETKENESVQVVKKKRGRPKSTIQKSEQKKLEVCEECGTAVRNLKTHLRTHLPVAHRERIPCSLCEKTFASQRYRNKHYKYVHLALRKKCNICSKAVINLNLHIRTTHNPDSLPVKCTLCPKRFMNSAQLKSHLVTHTKDKPHTCDLCDKKFSQKSTMLNHKKQVHEQERNHLCQFCSNSFFKKYHLQMHLRKHTKDKPHKCPDCGKYFSTTTGLNSHRLIHSAVKRFVCRLCDSKFSKPCYLRNHMITHTKEKRHPCKYCGVLFGRSDHRKRHEFTAHQKHLLSAP